MKREGKDERRKQSEGVAEGKEEGRLIITEN